MLDVRKVLTIWPQRTLHGRRITWRGRTRRIEALPASRSGYNTNNSIESQDIKRLIR
jgi:hypothetical protein